MNAKIAFLAVIGAALTGCLLPEQPPSAQLVVYVCPDFGACSGDAFLVNTTCVGHKAKPGALNTISYNLAPDTAYNVSACTLDCASCGGVASFTTPSEFPNETWRSGFNFYCSTPCDPPP